MKKLIINFIGIALMIMLNFNYSNAQFDCTLFGSGENQESQGEQEEEIEPYEGPMYVKLAIHIFRNDDGSGGITNEKLEETFDVIESIYSPHDIYFNYCIDEIHNTGLMVEAALNPYGFHPPLNEDTRIDCYIHFADAGGYTFGPLPHKWFVSSPKPHNIAHELGHALGLTHTFAGGCHEDAPYIDDDGELQYGENSYKAGDGVYDTPADLQDGTDSGTENSCYNTTYVDEDCIFQNPNNQKDSKGHKYRDIEYPEGSGNWNLAHNIMSYYSGCHKLITVGQEEKIRKKMNSPYMMKVIQDAPKIKEFNYDVQINDLTIWDDDRIINGDVHVLSGTLKLRHNNFYFTPGHKIILHPGSTLKSFFSIIDVTNDLNNCSGPFTGETWGGIEVKDYVTGQSATKISLKLTKINNAETAIYSSNKSTDIEIWASRFNDNHRAIELSGLEQGPVDISNSQFIYNGPTHFLKHISQLKFVNTTASLRSIKVLNNNDNVSGDEFYGIDIYNSHISLYVCTIKGWKNGISKLCGERNTFLDMYYCTIEDNYANGLYTKYNADVLNVKRSKFDNNGENGIFFDKDVYSIFDISNNDISNSDTGIKQEIKWERWHNNTLYYNNNFYDIANTGIDFKNDRDERDGPLFLCNKMEHTTGDHIVTKYAINELQVGIGSSTESDNIKVISAGNTYVNISGMNFEAKYLPYDVNYFYDPLVPKEDPVNSSGINKANPNFVLAANCPDNPFNSGGNGGPVGPKDPKGPGGDGPGDPDVRPGDPSDPTDWVEVFDSIETVLDSIEDVFDDWTDGGPNNDVITTITTVTTTTSDDVTDILTDLGPWLSEESAEVLIQYSDQFTSQQLVSIFSANPDLFMNSTVYNFAFGDNSPFSMAEQSVLNIASQQITDKTKLLVQLRDVKLNKEYIITQGEKSAMFATDSTMSIDYDKMRMWMEKRGDYSSKLGIADSYISEGNYSEAISYLQGISSIQELTQEELDDLNKYIELDQMLVNAYQNHRYIDELNSTEVELLENIANSSTMFAETKAQSILEYFYGFTFEDEEEIEGRSEDFKTPRKMIVDQISNIEISPNPNEGQFEMKLQNVSFDTHIKNVKILSLDGKVVENRDFDSAKVKIKLENILSGVYIYNITDSTGRLHIGKLIIK